MRLPGWFCRGKQCSETQWRTQFRVWGDRNTCCMGCLSLVFATPDSKQDRHSHLPLGSIILSRASCIKFVGQERWANAGSAAGEPAVQTGDGWGAAAREAARECSPFTNSAWGVRVWGAPAMRCNTPPSRSLAPDTSQDARKSLRTEASLPPVPPFRVDPQHHESLGAALQITFHAKRGVTA